MKIKIIAILTCLFLTVPILGFAQMSGNPAGTRGHGEWTVSAMASYFTQQQDHALAVTRRVMAKSDWGLTPWLNAYILVGGVQLEMQMDQVNIDDLESKYQLALGLGFNVTYPVHPKLDLWIGGHAIRFPAKGSFFEYNDLLTREYRMTYDWREFQGVMGLIAPVGDFRFFAAFAAWASQRLDSKEEYWMVQDGISTLGEVESEYRSGLWTGGLLGVELLLPKGYSISLEVMGFNSENYHVLVGIGQTGLKAW